MMEKNLEVVSVRLVQEPPLYSEETLRSPKQVVKLLARELATYDREVLCVLNLKNNGQPINLNIVSMGTINASLVEAREVFKASILSNAAQIILLHNHPSGNVLPSLEDQNITKRLVACGQLLGIPVMDHIIVAGGSGEFYSFQANHMLCQDSLQSLIREVPKKRGKGMKL